MEGGGRRGLVPWGMYPVLCSTSCVSLHATAVTGMPFSLLMSLDFFHFACT